MVYDILDIINKKANVIWDRLIFLSLTARTAIPKRDAKNKISENLKFISAAHITPIAADTARNIGETFINFILGMVFYYTMSSIL